jgi:3-carboxy-cis,cis-muconate cycloisomerase
MSSAVPAILTPLFSTPASTEIWSDKTRTAYYLLFESHLATAQAKLGIIPLRAADAIVKYCDVKYLDWRALQERTERVGYPVLGVVEQLVKKVNEEGGRGDGVGIENGDVEGKGESLGEWAHWGATTQVCRIFL